MFVQSPSTDGLEGASSHSSSNHGNIYQMELYRDFNHTNKLNFAGGNSAEVQFDETLYVRAWIEGGESTLSISNQYNDSCTYKIVVSHLC
jgi:hypothetical protein